MARLFPDPTFYPTPTMASEAPPEQLAYVALLSTSENGRTDALGVIDTNPESPAYGTLVGRVDFPNSGNELHHFGWNACSSHLCGYTPNPHMSVASSWYRVRTARAFTSSIPGPTRATRASSR